MTFSVDALEVRTGQSVQNAALSATCQNLRDVRILFWHANRLHSWYVHDESIERGDRIGTRYPRCFQC